MKKILLLITVFLFFCGCTNNNNKVTTYTGNQEVNSAQLITYDEAKKMKENGAIILDVRTIEEYNEKHIEGAILLSQATINEENAKKIIPTKNTTIIVYCRSGARSYQAGITLKNLGYVNVYDLGSIDNWKN